MKFLAVEQGEPHDVSSSQFIHPDDAQQMIWGVPPSSGK